METNQRELSTNKMFNINLSTSSAQSKNDPIKYVLDLTGVNSFSAFIHSRLDDDTPKRHSTHQNKNPK